jgi:Copper transport outer membrane protein, MctB
VVDFRYHVVSIVAVFLALGIGVLMGSAVLGENLIKGLRADLNDVRAVNEGFRAEIQALENQVSDDEEFARDAQAGMIAGALTGKSVVIVTIEGTDGDMLDQVRGLIEQAGGDSTTTISILDRTLLADDATTDQLALILGSASTDPEELRGELGATLGTRVGEVSSPEPKTGAPQLALDDLLTQLSDEGFIEVQSPSGEEPVAEASAILFVAGSQDDPPFRITELSVSFVTAVAQQGAAVVMSEPSPTNWAAVQLIRADDQARTLASTVDSAGSVSGQTSLILTLEEVLNGIRGRHYGVNDGAESTLPQPAPTS